MNSIRRQIGSCALLAVLLVGCGGPKLPEPVMVTGRVMQAGKPVTGATIGFSAIGPELPAKYRYAAGTTDDSGQFEIASVYPTEYMVSISKPAAAATATAVPSDAAAAPATTNARELAKYGDNSPLRAKVTAEETSFEFDLQ